MPANPLPGPVFEYLLKIKKELRKERSLFHVEKPLDFGFFSLRFEWLRDACDWTRMETRLGSFPEYWDEGEETPYYRSIHTMRLECISGGHAVVLLLNTCPIAEVDVKGEYGMAHFFELPPMDRPQWELWETLAASTTRFEIVPDSKELILLHMKEEEGGWNTLQMTRRINMTTGETSLSVRSRMHHMPTEPTLENLVDWVEVRAGRSHPYSLLQHN
jgi:hypothetical protein